MRYTGLECPVCQKAFVDTDSVAVCPECGAPHHPVCYQKLSRCCFADDHGTERQYVPPASKFKEHTQESGQYRQANETADGHCAHCGHSFRGDTIFCEGCGMPLRFLGRQDMPGATLNKCSQCGYPNSSDALSCEHCRAPFGSGIDGVTVSELQNYIGPNSSYFLNSFNKIKSRGEFSFNIMAALLGSFYFLYRKMRLWGFISLAITLILSAPTALLIINDMAETLTKSTFLSAEILDLLKDTISPFFYVISLAVTLLTGFFANRLYLNKAVREIKAIKKKTDCEIQTAIIKKGGVSPLSVVITISVIYVSLSILLNFFVLR